ncbi:MAG TPA: DMT family transporter [Gemmatimonadales bacterium]|nr:DMT family transporter [Gemmatimonadales bacterium]
MQTETRARLEILLVALLFSTGGAAIKAAHFTSWQVTGLRSGVAALTVWLLLPAARRFRQGSFGITLLVAAAYAATLTLFVLANKLTTAANTIFLQSTAPLYILMLGPLFLGERITRQDLGFMVAVAGGMALFFVGRQQTFATAPDPGRGNILAACSGLTYATMLMGLRWMGTHGGSPAGAVALGNLLALLVAVPWMLPFGGHGPGDWAVVLYLGVFQIGVAYGLLTRAVPHVPALETSLLLFLEPALNPLFAWAVHGEYPGLWALTGGVVIMGATGWKAWSDSRRAEVAPAATG